MSKNQGLIRKLIQLAYREHYNCKDDNWYGCPMSTDGCSNDSIPKKCNCGADSHNARVDAIAAELVSEQPSESQTPGSTSEVIALRTALANIHEGLGRAMDEAENEVASETMGGNAVKIREAMVRRAAVQGLFSGLRQIHPERIRDRIADLEVDIKKLSESSCYFENLLNKYRTKYGVELESELTPNTEPETTGMPFPEAARAIQDMFRPS